MKVGEFGCRGCSYGQVGASAGGCRYGRVGASAGGCTYGRMGAGVGGCRYGRVGASVGGYTCWRVQVWAVVGLGGCLTKVRGLLDRIAGRRDRL